MSTRSRDSRVRGWSVHAGRPGRERGTWCSFVAGRWSVLRGTGESAAVSAAQESGGVTADSTRIDDVVTRQRLDADAARQF